MATDALDAKLENAEAIEYSVVVKTAEAVAKFPMLFFRDKTYRLSDPVWDRSSFKQTEKGRK